jgi:uncharacterized protein (TIGR04255 family)
MADSLGAWKNAPLAYVLAEVRTEQLSDLKNYQPELSAAFRDRFPIQRTLVTARIVETSGSPPTVEANQDSAWEFATPENRVGFIIRPHGFVLHATTYQDHLTFLGCFKEALMLVEAKIPAIYMNRLGLRYVDFVIPKSGEEPEAYVDSRLNPELGLSKAPGESMTMSFASYPMANGRLTVRYIRGLGRPQLPPDISTIGLEKSALMERDDVSAKQPTAILDMDRIREFPKRRRLDADFVRTELQTMRDDVATAFKEHIITDHARTVWGAK